MEIEIVRFFYGIDIAILGFLLKAFTTLGEAAVLVLMVAVIYLCVDKKLGERFAFNILFSANLNCVLKGLIDRPRPFVNHSDIKPRNSLLGETHTGSSFPSGHTQTSASFFYTLASILKKWYFWLIATIIILLVAISRLYLGVHYLTDVLAGLFLGLLVVLLSNYLFNKFYEKRYWLYFLIGLFVLGFCFFIKKTTLEDYSKAIGIYFGYILGTFIENKYINVKIPKCIKN